MRDAITTTTARVRLAKLIHEDGRISPYARAKTFDFASQRVAGLLDIAPLLRRLMRRRDTAVVRGEPIDLAHCTGVRRLVHVDAKTGEVPTLKDAPRRWVALDMEGIALPPDRPVSDLAGCAALALATLPAVFSGAACIVQASGSHGFKPDVRLRLWFWLARPMTGTELKRWLRDTPADPSIFAAAQLIYTAAPIILGSRPDPVPERMIVLPGAPEVAPPSPAELALPPRPAAPPRPIAAEHVSRYGRKALERAADRIMHASKRHPTIISECRGLARLVTAGILTESDLRAVVREAARHAGKDDDAEIESCIAWALAHPSGGSVPEVSRA